MNQPKKLKNLCLRESNCDYNGAFVEYPKTKYKSRIMNDYEKKTFQFMKLKFLKEA